MAFAGTFGCDVVAGVGRLVDVATSVVAGVVGASVVDGELVVDASAVVVGATVVVVSAALDLGTPVVAGRTSVTRVVALTTGTVVAGVDWSVAATAPAVPTPPTAMRPANAQPLIDRGSRRSET